MSTYRKLKHLESVVTNTRKFSIKSSRKAGASFAQIEAVNLTTMKDETLYVLHNSIIATRAGNILTLDFHGWKTPTTRKYMDKALLLEGIEGWVFSSDGTQCIRIRPNKDEVKEFCFVDGQCRINLKTKTINLPTYEAFMNAKNRLNKWG